MRIGMVIYTFCEFGGLEAIVANLAVALQQEGHEVSVFSIGWAADDNQYVRRLREAAVPVVMPPRGVYLAAADWPTKEAIRKRTLRLLRPVTAVGASALAVGRGRSWSDAWQSAEGRIGEEVMKQVGPDRRETLATLLFRRWCRMWRPDILHFHGYADGLFFLLAEANSGGLPLAYQEHSTPGENGTDWNIYAKAVNQAELVLAVSDASAGALREVAGIQRPLRTVTPLVPDPGRAWFERQDSAAPAALRVTTLARLYEKKGLNYLLEAIPLVQRHHPYIVFAVFGEGPLRELLQAQAVNLDLDGRALFPGPFAATDLPTVMAGTDIFVLPSVSEGFPVTVVEAFAYGRPVVATTVGGVPELVEDEVNGLLCPPRDPAALARQIIRLANDPALRRKLGAAARASYEQGGYFPDTVARDFVAFYGEAIALAAGRAGREAPV